MVKSMAQFDKALNELAQSIMESDDFKATFTLFFDNLGENDAFCDSCKKTKYPVLKKIVKSAAENLYNESVMVTKFFLLKSSKHQFYHGSFFIDGKVSALIYFEKQRIGILSIANSLGPGENSFIRFSVPNISTKTPIITSTQSKVTLQ